MTGFVLYAGPKNIELQLLQDAADKLSINLNVIDPRYAEPIINSDGAEIMLNGKITPTPDFVISAFTHSLLYYNFAVLRQLESKGALCINRASVIDNTIDKLRTLQLLAESGIPVPKTLLYRPGMPLDTIEQEFTFPMVIKISGGSKGQGVVLAHNRKQLDSILQIATAGELQQNLLIQEMITPSKGRDLRVVICGGKAVTCAIRKSAETGEFRSNYCAGGTISSYELTDEIIKLANQVATKLGMFVGGIDLLFGEDGFVVCEANSVPGFHIPDNPGVWQIDIPQTLLKSIINELS
jgi:RimK family alpha-L-glutamate ligase